MIIYLFAILSVISQSFYIRFINKNKNVLGAIAKTIASLLFVLIGYLAYKEDPSLLNRYILIGFVFDAIGDVLLALRNLFLHTAMFASGTISFMIGHVFFISGLNHYVDNMLLIIAFGVVLGIVMYMLYYKVCTFPTIFKIIGPIYCMMIVIIATSAIIGFSKTLAVKNLTMMIGLLSFNLSDMILIIYNFCKKEKWLHSVYSFLYFFGQCVIGISLFM